MENNKSVILALLTLFIIFSTIGLVFAAELSNGLFNDTVHVISQSILISVMVVLAIFIYALINLGVLIAEYYKKGEANLY
jgi:hypothetical protein